MRFMRLRGLLLWSKPLGFIAATEILLFYY